MNKTTLPTLFLLVLCFFSGHLQAQDGYTYTFIDNGPYNYSIAVIPDASASNFATSVQSYGFTIILPDGITATITSSFGSGAGATFFNGSDVGMPSSDGYLITETLGSLMSLPAPSTATATPLITIQVNGSPTSGFLYILPNNSSLANAVTPLKSFMQADMIDDGMSSFANVVDPNALGVSGNSGINFATLSTSEVSLDELSIYPNPATDIVSIKGLNTSLTALEIYNSTGQLVLTKENDLNTFDVSKLKSGVYFVKMYTEEAIKTVKLVRK